MLKFHHQGIATISRLALSNPASKPIPPEGQLMIGFAAVALTVANLTLMQNGTQPAPRDPTTTAIAQRTATPPTIDGLGTDPVWALVPKTDNFLEFDPKPSQPARFKTEF